MHSTNSTCQLSLPLVAHALRADRRSIVRAHFQIVPEESQPFAARRFCAVVGDCQRPNAGRGKVMEKCAREKPYFSRSTGSITFPCVFIFRLSVSACRGPGRSQRMGLARHGNLVGTPSAEHAGCERAVGRVPLNCPSAFARALFSRKTMGTKGTQKFARGQSVINFHSGLEWTCRIDRQLNHRRKMEDHHD
jgi:hypothetical protein